MPCQCQQWFREVEHCEPIAVRTSRCTHSTTSSEVVNDRSIAFHSTVHSEIATKACIGNFLVFKNFDRKFDGVNGTCSIVEKGHG